MERDQFQGFDHRRIVIEGGLSVESYSNWGMKGHSEVVNASCLEASHRGILPKRCQHPW